MKKRKRLLPLIAKDDHVYRIKCTSVIQRVLRCGIVFEGRGDRLRVERKARETGWTFPRVQVGFVYRNYSIRRARPLCPICSKEKNS